jgi:hypothetical protein
MSSTNDELIKKLDMLLGESIIDPKILKCLLNPKTRQETLEEFSFSEDEINTMMGLESENIEGFGRKALEAFGIPLDIGKERK